MPKTIQRAFHWLRFDIWSYFYIFLLWIYYDSNEWTVQKNVFMCMKFRIFVARLFLTPLNWKYRWSEEQ